MGSTSHDEGVGFGKYGGPQGDTDKEAWSEAWVKGEPPKSEHIEPVLRGIS
jgi:hypothetical protein